MNTVDVAGSAPATLGVPPPRGWPSAFAHDQAFERIVAALQDAALRDAAWPRALALIDDACGMHSSHLVVLDAPGGSVEHLFGMWRGQGTRLDALAREYAEDYFATDERVRRLLLLPAGTLIHNADLYTPQEQLTSRTCNAFLLRLGLGNQLAARLAGLDGSHIVWIATRTRAQGEWRPAHIAVLTRLLPHIAGAVRAGQALAKADAHVAALAFALDASDEEATGVALLDRRGKVARTNACGQRVLAEGGLLRTPDGVLSAPAPDADRLGELIAQALPRQGRAPRSVALELGQPGAQVEVRVTPVHIARMDLGARRIAAVATMRAVNGEGLT